MKSSRAHPHEKPHHPHRPLACLLFVFVLLLGIFSVHEPLTWLHIQLGQRFLAEGSLLAQDAFSYTFSGRPWASDSWLADVVFQRLHSSGGPWALVLFKALTCAAAFTLLLPVSPASPLLAAGVLSLGALAAWPGLTETPAFFDMLLLALLLRALRPRGHFHWAMVAQVGLIELLWSNLHASTAILGVWIAGIKAFKASLRQEKTEDSLRHGALVLAALAGFALNPLGFDAVPLLFNRAADAAGGWNGVLLAAGPYFVFAAAGFAACWMTLQQEFYLTLTAASLLLLSLVFVDLRPLYVLGACPVITLALGHFVHSFRDTLSRVLRLALVLAAAFALHFYFIYRPLAGQRGYSVDSLAGALHFLDANGVQGRMFNEPESGAALLAAGRSVFVDSRPGLYGRAFLEDARQWSRQWSRLSEVYEFDYAVLLNRRSGYPCRILDEEASWVLVYADDAALVYINKKGVNAALASSAAIRLLRPNRLWPEAMDERLSEGRLGKLLLEELDRWILQSPGSLQALLWKAYALERLGMPHQSDMLVDAARRHGKLRSDAELLACLGFVQDKRGLGREAEANYRKAASLARWGGRSALRSGVLRQMALLAERQGRMGRARRLMELATAGEAA